MARFWISWWSHPTVGFELHSPWWVTGYSSQGFGAEEAQRSLCAAVLAENAEAAKAAVVAAHDAPVDLEWRFVEHRPDSWSPFNDRFPRKSWMRWPAEAEFT